MKPKLFSINKDTKIVFSKISPEFSEDEVYLSFIKYCKFNSGITLDDDLMRLCIKISQLSFHDSLEEKKEIMKSEGLNYSLDSLNQLINIISRKILLILY